MFTTKEGSHRKVEYKILVILCLVIIYLRESFSERKTISRHFNNVFLYMENINF